jgi:ubiquitin-protein ligase
MEINGLTKKDLKSRIKAILNKTQTEDEKIQQVIGLIKKLTDEAYERGFWRASLDEDEDMD